MKFVRILLAFLGSAVVLTLDAQEMDLESGLVAYWPLDEIHPGGVIRDHSGYNFHGAITGGGYSSGVRGGGLSLDGRDDMVIMESSAGAVPTHISDLDQGSISIWFRLDQVPEGKGIQPIFYFGSWTECANMFDAANQGIIIEVGHHPVHYRSKRLYFTIFANGCAVPSFCFDSWVDLETDRWYHFVAVVGEDYNTGYLNGEPMEFINYNFGDASYSQFFQNAVDKSVIWLGKGFWDAEPYHMDGSIDELRIYNRPLSADEVNALYRSTLTTGTGPDQENTPLVLYPNPAEEKISFLWKEGSAGDLEQLTMTDLQGRVLFRQTFPGKQALDESISLDLQHFSPGVYFLEIVTPEGRWSHRFIRSASRF